MGMKRAAMILLGALVGAALMMLLGGVSPNQGSSLQKRLFDAGHFAVFGAFSLAALAVVRGIAPRLGLLRYVWAAAASIAFGLITELVQFFGPRDASFLDVLRNMAGIVSVLGMVLVLDPEARLSARVSAVLIAVGVFSFLVCIAPVLELQFAYWQRDRIQPRLSDFRSYWLKPLWYGTHAEVSSAGELEYPDSDDLVKVTFQPGTKYPRFVIRDLFPDWSGSDHFAFEVFLPQAEPPQLHLRLDDQSHNQHYEDRYNVSLNLHMGNNRIRIPITDLQHAPKDREMDLRHMASLAIFAVDPADTFSVFLGGFRLEQAD